MSARTPEPMSAERLAEIAARAEVVEKTRLTPDSSWEASPFGDNSAPPPMLYVVEDVARLNKATVRGSVGAFGDERHAEFAAHARDDIPALLAEVTRLRSEAAASRAAVLDEAADAVARFTGNDLDANAKMLRRMAAAARDAQTGGE
ncbi:hypothetical protein [Streptomyces sp. 184]|uniref:hypothetical protein n=1 Tax=Streptomyces sp. 184 TaxID=1827526 RepID=UPI00389293C1